MDLEFKIEIIDDISYDEVILLSWSKYQISAEIIELQCNFGSIILSICHQTSIVF